MGFVDQDSIGSRLCSALGLGDRLIQDLQISFRAGEMIRVNTGEWMRKQQGDEIVNEIETKKYVLVDFDQYVRFVKWQELDAAFSTNGDTPNEEARLTATDSP